MQQMQNFERRNIEFKLLKSAIDQKKSNRTEKPNKIKNS